MKLAIFLTGIGIVSGWFIGGWLWTRRGGYRGDAFDESEFLEPFIDPYLEALIWMSGADDFAPSGKAREGFEQIVVPLLRKGAA